MHSAPQLGRFHSFQGTKILCVGDAMLDVFVYGAVDRISPEAPIPVLRVDRESEMLGGAGNVAANLAALGAAVRFVSVVGNDQAGSRIRSLLAEQIGTGPDLVVEDGRLTTTKTRFLAGSQQLLRADRETAAEISDEARSAVIDLIEDDFDPAAIVLSDYGKGVLSEAVIAAAIAAAGARGMPVIVDPKGVDYTRYRGASVVTPNRKELAGATGMPVKTDAEIADAARRIIESCGIAAVIATRGEHGMSVVTGEGQPIHLPARAREVFDVSGAGDTVVASLALALGSGLPLVEAARIANLAAGIVVGKVGTAVVRTGELQAALHQQEWLAGEAKVATLDDAAERVERWRRQGSRVGFTNGVFDLLHPGHIAVLRQSRAACDRLVVGINSDASVKRLKGPTRPVQTEASRAAVLASLEMVDLVVIFGEDTPLALIERLRPDVLVKGADYRIDQVVGADVVHSYGGRVVLAQIEPGHSTTATIARMANG